MTSFCPLPSSLWSLARLNRNPRPSDMFKRGSKSSKSAVPGPQGHQFTAFTTFIVLVFVIAVFLFQTGGKPRPSITLTLQNMNNSKFSMQSHPVVEYMNGTDMIWQIPDSPKAVLFLAHGCNGRAVNFWDRSSECPKCIGLPEERLIVLQALARRYAVLTVSSAGRCWSFGEERLIVKGIIKWWTEKNKLEKLPLVALGASSGGYFVSVLATDLRFSSVVLMIAEGMFDQLDIPDDYPPTLFVHMPKDRFRKRKVDKFIEVLRDKGIDVAEVKCLEFPLSPTFLSERISNLDETLSVKLYELFRDKGFIDSNGYMKNDGRATHWKQAFRKTGLLLSVNGLHNHIQEELNLAFAYHEMTSLQSEQIFNWFKSHMN